ncbi:hypothetical protein [Streptomyces afghaniensis]|uniref:hypothetical protein n=1 Tax=Streptomyces afghaniensis TaxID=66865 RepID=UPI00358F10A7
MGDHPPQPRQRRPPRPAPPRPGLQHEGPPGPVMNEADREREQQRLDQETKNERHMWWWLAYFLFGIHIVAFVMIYAVMHAPK